MAKQLPNKNARTTQKTTDASPTKDEQALTTTEDGYTVPKVGGDGEEQVEDTAVVAQDEQEQGPAPEEPAPLVMDSRVGPVTMPEEPQVVGGLGLVPPKPRTEPLPPLPANEPDGVVLAVGDPLIVRGWRLSDTVVETSEPVYRRILAPNSSRWSHILLYPARHKIVGKHVKLVSEVEEAVAA